MKVLLRRWLRPALYAISFSAKKDAAAIANAGTDHSFWIRWPRSFKTAFALVSSASVHLRPSAPLSFFLMYAYGSLFVGHISRAIAERFSVSSVSKNSFAVIDAKVIENNLKIMYRLFGTLKGMYYFSGTVDASHYTLLTKLSMANNATEVKRGEFVGHFDFNI